MNVTEWMAHLKDVLMADQHRLIRLQMLWTKHYFHYHIQLTKGLAMEYASLCIDQDELMVEGALVAWTRRGPSNYGHKPRPALPGDILREINDELYPHQEAAELAAKAWGLLASPGSGNVPEVKRRIGPIGTTCYDMMGGVQQLCRHTNEDDRSSFIAQFRDLAEAQIIRRNRHKEMASFAALPAKPEVQALPQPQQVAPDAQLPAATRQANPDSVAFFQKLADQMAAKMNINDHV